MDGDHKKLGSERDAGAKTKQCLVCKSPGNQSAMLLGRERISGLVAIKIKDLMMALVD